MEKAHFSETLANVHQTTWCQIYKHNSSETQTSKSQFNFKHFHINKSY